MEVVFKGQRYEVKDQKIPCRGCVIHKDADSVCPHVFECTPTVGVDAVPVKHLGPAEK